VWWATLARRPVGLEIVGCDAAKLANLFRDLLASGGHNFRVLVFCAVAKLGNNPKNEFVGRVRNWVFLDVSDHVRVLPFAYDQNLARCCHVVKQCFADGSKRMFLPVLKRLGHGLAVIGSLRSDDCLWW
jgi:hypothetical protein